MSSDSNSIMSKKLSTSKTLNTKNSKTKPKKSNPNQLKVKRIPKERRVPKKQCGEPRTTLGPFATDSLETSLNYSWVPRVRSTPSMKSRPQKNITQVSTRLSQTAWMTSAQRSSASNNSKSNISTSTSK